MLRTLAVAALAGCMAFGAGAAARAEGRPGVAPDAAWHMLVLGNNRFAGGLTVAPHLDSETRRGLLRRQEPWAVVVADSDSRVSPEFIFDLGLGDLYVVRTAGAVVAPGPTVDSVAYALGRLGPRLVVVLGHSHDAVTNAALDNAKEGAEGRLAADVAPAVDQARDKIAGLSGDALEAEAVEQNVLLEMKRLLKDPEIGDKVRSGRVKVIGGVYDLDNGRVRWLGEHPQQDAILAGKQP